MTDKGPAESMEIETTTAPSGIQPSCSGTGNTNTSSSAAPGASVKRTKRNKLKEDILDESGQSDSSKAPSESILDSGTSSPSSSSSDSYSGSSSESESGSDKKSKKRLRRKVKAAIAKAVKEFKQGKKKKSKSKATPAERPGPEETTVPIGTDPAPHAVFDVPEKYPAYEAVKEARQEHYNIRNIFGGRKSIEKPGSFRNEGDNRAVLTREHSNRTTETTSSFSFTYSNIYCSACEKPHPILGRGVKPVFVLSDQAFPPAIPALDGGRCLAVVRVEDGSLNDIWDLFREKIRTEWLPEGTTLLIGSASHLARFGTAAYLEEYVKTVNRIAETIPGATVAHAPLLLLNGSNNPALIRSMLELSNWLLAIEGENGEAGFDFSSITNTWTDLLHSCSIGATQANYAISMVLPSSREMPLVKKVWISEPLSEIPAGTSALTQTEEGCFLDKLISQLNRTLHVELSTAIQVERTRIRKQNSGPQPPQQQSFKNVLFVGDRTANKLATEIKKTARLSGLVQITKLDPISIGTAAAKIREKVTAAKIKGSEPLVVYCLLEDRIFSNEKGIRASETSDGVLHIQGEVRIAQRHHIEPYLSELLPLLEAGGNVPKILLTPLPEFTAGPCCDLYQDASNAGTNDFISLLRTRLGQIWRGLKDFAENEHLPKTRAVNAAATVIDVPKEVAWSGSKLTEAAYKAVLDCILAEAENIRGKRPSAQQSDTEKRRRSGSERTVIETDRRRFASEGSRYPESDRTRHSSGSESGRYPDMDRTRHSSDGGHTYNRDRNARYGEPDRSRSRY